MYLAYMHCYGTQSEYPELCLIPDRPDQFSVPVRVDSLVLTEVALLRLGPLESLLVKKDDSDGGWVLQAVTPSKLYLTVNDPQFPGLSVSLAKVVKVEDRKYRIFYRQSKEASASAEWQPWEPNKTLR